MPSEYTLRLRIEQAVKDAERANANHDGVAYERARLRYEAANEWLTKLEAERNARVVDELEARAEKQGHLTYAACVRVGVPIELMKARGWEAVPQQPFMRKAKADGPATSDSSDGS